MLSEAMWGKSVEKFSEKLSCRGSAEKSHNKVVTTPKPKSEIISMANKTKNEVIVSHTRLIYVIIKCE